MRTAVLGSDLRDLSLSGRSQAPAVSLVSLVLPIRRSMHENADRIDSEEDWADRSLRSALSARGLRRGLDSTTSLAQPTCPSMKEESPESPLTFGSALERFAFTQSPSKCRPSSPSPRASSSQPSSANAPATVRRSPTRRNGTLKQNGSSPYFKRSASDEEEGKELIKDEGGPSPKKKKKPSRPYADPSLYAHLEDRLHDCVREGLGLLCCGINPGASCRLVQLDSERALNPANSQVLSAQRWDSTVSI